MTIHVEFKPEMAAQLAAEASAQGLPLEKVAERLLLESLASRLLPQGTLDKFHAMLKSLASGSEALPDLATETFTRETSPRPNVRDRS